MTDYPTNSTAKPYFGIDGEPRTLWQMVRDEPEWAVSRIKAGEESIAQCDEYRKHLAVIAEMTGNAGDIGAAHEGVNAVIEERDALAAHLESLTSLWTELGYSMADGNDDAGQLWQALENLFASKSAASLARRDALKKAEGLRLAADFIEQKATNYDAEHGNTDPSTGHREYPGDGAEYYNEMMELADDLRQQAEGFQ